MCLFFFFVLPWPYKLRRHLFEMRDAHRHHDAPGMHHAAILERQRVAALAAHQVDDIERFERRHIGPGEPIGIGDEIIDRDRGLLR